MKLSRSSLAVLRQHKPLLIVTLCSLLIAVGLGYVAWSKQQWGEFEPTYKAHQTAIQTSLDALKSRNITTATNKAKVRTDLAEISRQIDARGKEGCQMSPLVAWQASIIASLQHEREQCQTQATKMTALNTPLKRVITFLSNDAATATELTKVSPVDEVADTAWQAQLDGWKSASQAIKKQSVGLDYKPIQQLAVEKVDALVTAWQAVIAAHGAKDKQKYTSAQADLGQAYDGLDMISLETAKVAGELAKVVEDKYQAAF